MSTPSPADAPKQIRERYDQFEKQFAQGDAAALVASYYVRQPFVSAPDTPLLQDHKSIEGLFKGLMETVAAVRFESIEIRQSGELAYEVGRAFLTMKGEAAAQGQARYLVVWRWTAAGWRVEADFFALGNLI
jgi:ketosteroid isomerase-like protein